MLLDDRGDEAGVVAFTSTLRPGVAAKAKTKTKVKKAKPDAEESDGKPGLWDPLPITVPTYVSKPLAPRTVRTIDLSGPGAASPGRPDGPVTADAPAAPVREVRPGFEEDGRQVAAS